MRSTNLINTIDKLREYINSFEGYELLDTEYKGSKFKYSILHKKCGTIFTITANDFQQGKRCFICNRKQRLTIDIVQTKINNILPNEYTILSTEYTNIHTKLKIRHNICSHEFEMSANNLLNTGNRCPKCSKRIRKDTDYFKQEVYELEGSIYTVLSEYTGTNNKVKFRHNICNDEFYMTPNDFLNGKHRCPKCSGNKKKTIDDIKKEVYDLVKDEYTVISDTYVNTNTKILIRHNNCKHIYEVTPNKFIISGRRCPICNISNGENAIFQFLSDNNIGFEREKMFKECYNINLLKFDFYIPNLIHKKTGKKVNLVIEFNGIQHYKPGFGTGIDGLLLVQKRDNIKKEFINKGQKGLGYNLLMLTIPYTKLPMIDEYLTHIFNNVFEVIRE